MRPHDHVTNVDSPGVDRREFLRLSSALAAAGALASTGCQVPPEAAVPFHDMPEDLVDGVGRVRTFRTVVDGTPVLVRTREGHPILVTPDQEHPSGRGASLRHHAALMDLYDPDRARGPLSVRRGGPTVASSWDAISGEAVTRLKAAGSKAVLLTAPVTGPALGAAIEALAKQTGLRHVVWSPLDQDSVRTAWRQALGTETMPRPRLDKADLLVGFGAEFLDRPEEGLEHDFARRHSPDQPDGRRMSRFIQFEGRLTLTGASADRRIRIRDSHLPLIAAALAHELIVAKQIGPLAADRDVVDALGPHTIEQASATTGVAVADIRAIADELAAGAGRTIVLAGGSASAAASGRVLELAVVALNATLGAFDADLFEAPIASSTAAGCCPAAQALTSLAADMLAGHVDALIVAGVNPVYDAPPPMRMAHAIAKVPFVVSLNDRLDETSVHADYLVPASHPFECWDDAALPRGLFAIQQPVLQPLFDTRGLLDVLVDWAAAAGNGAAAAAVAAATSTTLPPAAATAQRAPSGSVAWHYLRGAWAARLTLDVSSPAFDTAWNDLLRNGTWQEPAAARGRLTIPPAAAREIASALHTIQVVDGLELQLYPHLALGDGRRANNGWLHELPDPITRITWGGALSIAPRRFDELRLANGDLVEVRVGEATLVAPAYRHAGMHHDQIALPLGLGRVACGAIGAGVGHNAFALRQVVDGRLIAAALPVTLRRVEGHEALAFGQGSDVIDRARRPLVPTTTLTAYEEDQQSGTEQDEGGPSAWPEHEYPNARWAMAIDLSKCIGCGKCVVGCQAENNVPVAGRRNILDGREMSWLRIDRYYDAPAKDGGWDAEVWDGPLEVVEEPQVLFEPMLCQHCENAPCESVCPFDATMHSEDGLNQQIYNRCVGTRYCANNCPFKVRRFNYFEYSKPQESAFFRWLVPRIARNAELNTREPIPLKNNPEVTVRSRGVMEKCSFCIQRIRAARAQATRDGQSKDRLPDGAVVPACMEACPTRAITFGDLHAPGSRVAALTSHPRAMRLLDALGVKPSISYLTKVRNDKA